MRQCCSLRANQKACARCSPLPAVVSRNSRLPGAYTGFGAGLTLFERQLPGLLAVQLENSGIRHRLDKQIRQSPDERVDSIRRITRCGAVKIASEPAHLIFERRKSADVMNFVLLVKRSYGFGADDFSAAGPHRRDRHIGVDHADGRLDHVAAVIALGDNAVRCVRAVKRNGDASPLGRRISS